MAASINRASVLFGSAAEILSTMALASGYLPAELRTDALRSLTLVLSFSGEAIVSKRAIASLYLEAERSPEIRSRMDSVDSKLWADRETVPKKNKKTNNGSKEDFIFIRSAVKMKRLSHFQDPNPVLILNAL